MEATTPVVIRCGGLVGRLEHVACDGTTPADEYLQAYAPDAHEGRGQAVFTRDMNRAMVFANLKAAWEYIGQRPTARPTRPDGKPNRPLTAFRLHILPRDAAG